MNYPTKCRKCGKPIILMDTFKGKRFPVDREPAQFIIGGAEKQRFVTSDGDIYRGQIAGETELEHDKVTGWPCHYDTCEKE